MLSLLQVVAEDVDEFRIVDEAPADSVQKRREPVDRRGDRNAAGLQHAERLAERRQPLLPRGQVVERPHEKHGIGGALAVGQRTGIADGGTRQWMIRLRRRGRERLLHVPRHRIDEMHIVAASGEPARIPAGAAADVQHHPRRRRQEAPDQLLPVDAGELERPGAARQPPLFVVPARSTITFHASDPLIARSIYVPTSAARGKRRGPCEVELKAMLSSELL